MSTYEPGTVAVVTWDNAPLASQRRGESDVQTMRAMHTDDGRWSLQSGWNHCITDDVVTDIRPLVVLNSSESPEPLTAAAASVLLDASAEIVEKKVKRPVREVALLRWLADQIEAQVKPSRMAEPGPWGVVEATGATLPRRRWVHHEEGRWVCDTGVWRYWDDLIDPQPVRDGIEDGAL